MRKVLLAGLVFLGIGSHVCAQGLPVNITVQPAEWANNWSPAIPSPSGTRTNAPVTFGLPIPDSAQIACPNTTGNWSSPATSLGYGFPPNQEAPTQLQLQNGSGGQIPAQMRCMAVWPDGYAMWVLFDSQIPSFTEGSGNFDNSINVVKVASGGGNFGGFGSNMANYCTGLNAPVTGCPDNAHIIVTTGAATILIKESAYNLFDSVTVGSTPIIQASDHDTTTDGLFLSGPPYGSSGLASVTCKPDASGTTGPPIPTSSLASAGSNLCSQAYTSQNDTTAAGVPCTAIDNIASCYLIEENGPLRVVILNQGDFNDGSGHVYMHWRTRTICWYSQSYCEVDPALRNADAQCGAPSTQTFCDAGKVFGALEERLTDGLAGGSRTFSMGSYTSNSPVDCNSMAATQACYLWMGHEQVGTWAHYDDEGNNNCKLESTVCLVSPIARSGTPYTQAYALNGYQMVGTAGAGIATGTNAQNPIGYADFDDGSNGIEAGVYQFYMDWPKSLEAQPGISGHNQIRIGVKPNQLEWLTTGGSYVINPSYSSSDTTCANAPCEPRVSYAMPYMQYDITRTLWDFHAGTQSAAVAQNDFLYWQHPLIARATPGCAYYNSATDAATGIPALFYQCPDPVAQDAYYANNQLFSNECGPSGAYGLAIGSCVSDVNGVAFPFGQGPPTQANEYPGMKNFNFYIWWLTGGNDGTQFEERFSFLMDYIQRGCVPDLTHLVCNGAGTAGSVPGRYIYADQFYRMIAEKTLPRSDGVATSGSSAGFRQYCTSFASCVIATGAYTKWGDPRAVNQTAASSLWNVGQENLGDNLDAMDHSTYWGIFTMYFLSGDEWLHEQILQGFKDRYQNPWVAYNNLDSPTNNAGYGQNTSPRQMGHMLSNISRLADFLWATRDPDMDTPTTVATSPGPTALAAAMQAVAPMFFPLLSGGYPAGFAEASGSNLHGTCQAVASNLAIGLCAQGTSPVSGFARPEHGGEPCLASTGTLPGVWKAHTSFPTTSYVIIDSNTPQYGFIWAVLTPGTAGTLNPGFVAADASGPGTTLTDNQSTLWTPNTVIAKNFYILDSNGNFEESSSSGGTTQSGTHPTWNATTGGTTTESTGLVWTNEGPQGTPTVWINQGVAIGPCTGPANNMRQFNNFMVGSAAEGIYDLSLELRKMLGPNWHIIIGKNGLSPLASQTNVVTGGTGYLITGATSIPGDNIVESDAGLKDLDYALATQINTSGCVNPAQDPTKSWVYGNNHGSQSTGCQYNSTLDYMAATQYCGPSGTANYIQPCQSGISTGTTVGGSNGSGNSLRNCATGCGGQQMFFALDAYRPWTNSTSDLAGKTWQFIGTVQEQNQGVYHDLANHETQYMDYWIIKNGNANVGPGSTPATCITSSPCGNGAFPVAAAAYPLTQIPLTSSSFAFGTATGTKNANGVVVTGSGTITISFPKPSGLCVVGSNQCPPFGPGGTDLVLKYYVCLTAGGSFITQPGQNVFGNDCPAGGKQIVPSLGFSTDTLNCNGNASCKILSSSEPSGFTCATAAGGVFTGGTFNSANPACTNVIGSVNMDPASYQSFFATVTLPDCGANGSSPSWAYTYSGCNATVPSAANMGCSGGGTCTYTMNVVAGQTYTFGAYGYEQVGPSLAPGSYAFLSAAIGTHSADSPTSGGTFTFTNPTAAALTGFSVSASTNFSETNTCGSSVASNGTCTISVSFTPTATGNLTGTVSATWTSAGGGTDSATLSGTGLASGGVCIIPPLIGAACDGTYTYDSSNVGVASADSPAQETLSNTTGAGLSSIACSTTGTDASDFTLGGTCATTLANDAIYQIPTTFTPGAGGSRTGNLSVSYGGSSGTIRTAASCAESDVAAKVALSSNGDTVIIPGCTSTTPGGSNTWTSTLSVNVGITLEGQGVGSTVLIDNTDKGNSSCSGAVPMISITTPGTTSAHITGFTLQGDSPDTYICQPGHIVLSSFGTSNQIDHISITNQQTAGIRLYDCVYGVIDNNTFNANHKDGIINDGGECGNDSDGDYNWSQPSNFGGSNFLFIETNTFIDPGAVGAGAMDNFGGSRVVFRHNTASFVVGHGTESDQRNRGMRACEIYNNTFTAVENGQFAGVYVRSGACLIHDNNFVDGGGGNSYSGFINLINDRSTDAFPPWGAPNGSGNAGACDGTGPYDNNIGGVIASGTASGSSTANNLVVSGTSPGWTTNQYVGSYTIRNVTQGWGAIISANGANTVTNSGSAYGQNRNWSSGDSFEILEAYPCLDQAGRGQGNLISGAVPTPYAWPSEASDPIYQWNNTHNGTGTITIGSQTTIIKSGRDYYDNTAAPGYTPYTYPNPLIGGGGTVTAPLAGTGIGGSVTISPGSYGFQPTTAGTTSPDSPAPFVITNNTSGTITITGASVGTADFAAYNPCTTIPSGTPPANQCTVQASFSPLVSDIGNLNDTLTITYTGASGSPLSVPLSGTSTAPNTNQVPSAVPNFAIKDVDGAPGDSKMIVVKGIPMRRGGN
jgi:hypothetical protein